ncbi:MAG: tRNA (adenosine(37)-N6)-threonylcarbamoyltransferase complex dimerization subunit type 1 TsaB [Salinibacterium sp.]|nr:tRNA (adenosine(37)-N6)-threonylcarbamoyltransferase complex dimerization subunit type 1 TsaB [Salinibacterium sp.]
MLTLAIEVSNPSSGSDSSQVALGSVSEAGISVLGLEQVEPGSRRRDDLIPACDRLLARCGKRPTDLEAIAVDVGPGGFTGLRVAVAAGASMALALGARLIAVPAARVAAVSAPPGPFAVVLATKRERGWVEVNRDGEPAAGREMGTAEFSALVPPGEPLRIIADEHLPDAWRAIAAERKWSLEPIRLNATALLAAAAAAPVAVEPRELRPIYAREPEAVTLWNARNPRPSG